MLANLFVATVLMQAVPTATLPQSVAPDPLGEAEFSWMAGSWLECRGGRQVAEIWLQARDGSLAGLNLTQVPNANGVEFARVARTDAGWAYLAQPDGAAPTPFVLSEFGPQRAVFLNAENDFPNRVIYWREGDVLKARIEGTLDGRDAAQTWTFAAAAPNQSCPQANP
jgi:hypothetical protein